MKTNRSVTPERTVIRAVIATTAIVVGAAVCAAPASAAEGPIAGTWVSVDVPDGSNQTLTLHGGANSTYSAFLLDDFTTGVCGGPPAKVVGAAVAEDDVLFIQGTLICLGRGNALPGVRVDIALTYDPVSDTLTDEGGVVWDRAG